MVSLTDQTDHFSNLAILVMNSCTAMDICEWRWKEYLSLPYIMFGTVQHSKGMSSTTKSLHMVQRTSYKIVLYSELSLSFSPTSYMYLIS